MYESYTFSERSLLGVWNIQVLGFTLKVANSATRSRQLEAPHRSGEIAPHQCVFPHKAAQAPNPRSSKEHRSIRMAIKLARRSFPIESETSGVNSMLHVYVVGSPSRILVFKLNCEHQEER